MNDSQRPTGRPHSTRARTFALVVGLSAILGQLLGWAPAPSTQPASQIGARQASPVAAGGQTPASGTSLRTLAPSDTATSATPAASASAKPTRPAKVAATPRPLAPKAASGNPQTNVLASPSNAVYMHYYLWWTPRHWREKLGAQYPYAARPLPAPGTFDASGCRPTVRYSGATIVDVPIAGLYDQGSAATLDLHIAEAASVGITGFVANWQGTGIRGQGAGSSGYNSRLDLLVSRVNRYNAAHASAFRLVLGMDAFGSYGRPASQIIADLDYFRTRYAGNPAFLNRYSRVPMVMWMASRRLPLATVQAVSAAERGRLFLLGDETANSWNRDAPYLNGGAYYWSSQDPWNNPQSGSQIAALAARVHAAGKPWFAPFNGGFNTQLNGGSTCVPRRGVSTLDAVWNLNRPSRPQAWFGISWNEYVENTHLEPTALYGRRYLDDIGRLIRS